MNCPFCAEEIKDQALVCRHCGRDLAITRPFVDKVKALEGRLAALEGRLAALEEQPAVPAAVEPEREAETPRRKKGPGAGRAIMGVVTAIIVPVLALLVAHWLVVMVFDTRLWVLRILSILLPLFFALKPPFAGRGVLTVQAVIGLVVGVAAVAAMTVEVALIDKAPIMPEGAHEWREAIEYAVSIWLGYLTGALLGALLGVGRPRKNNRTADGFVRALAKATAPENETRAQFEARMKTLSGMVGSLVPLVTAVTSIVAGMRALMP